AAITEVVGTNQSGQDSIFFYGQWQTTNNRSVSAIPKKTNAFRFSYTATNFSDLPKFFSTKLEGFDEQWSSWTTKTTKEYTNLNSGSYRFLVRAKLDAGAAGAVASYAFTIPRPWYLSKIALFAYFMVGLFFILGLIFIPKKQFKQQIAELQFKQDLLKSEQAQRDKVHQQVVEKREQAINDLKNKQLETEIIHKNKELALTTMHLLQRSELINKLQEPLAQILRKTTNKTAILEIKRINKMLQEDAKMTDSWEQFASHFDQVHVDFIQRLREKYPQLTKNDRKLCAYLRMNLSTKEIAPLMNISVRGVEVARYRLRKKIDLDSSVNLTEFMLSV
ncbi:MAG: triple tyrosine motif-containing protein, partial [Bacteroidota bacterium]